MLMGRPEFFVSRPPRPWSLPSPFAHSKVRPYSTSAAMGIHL